MPNLQIPTPDDQRRARLALLTDKERECLVRWLTHATAKEIALQLGVSHHAVEKRLKSARQKLGVATTLEAARMLAASEDYGRTASQPPEVATNSGTQQVEAFDPLAAASTVAPYRTWVIAGGTIMSMFLAFAVLATLGQQAPTAAPQADAPRMPEVVLVNRKTGQPGDFASGLGQAFDRLDKDNNDLLEGSEITSAHFRVVRAPSAQAAPGASGTNPIAGFDGDKDGRVTRQEFLAGMMGLTERSRQPRV